MIITHLYSEMTLVIPLTIVTDARFLTQVLGYKTNTIFRGAKVIHAGSHSLSLSFDYLSLRAL